jgi:predicted DNA-binding helix-hairpin-helix protein
MREHRLYQADWLLRFYGFAWDELETDPAGNLSLEMDPKLAWALAHRALFPVNVNTAPKEMLLRIPGLGVRTAGRIIEVRRYRSLRLEDLARLRLPLRKLMPFVTTADHHPGASLDSARLAHRLVPPARQLELI